MPSGGTFFELKRLVRQHRLHTVCEEAMCPNIGECWDQRSATFMLLGDTCTRSCGFCAVKTGRPGAIDEQEPERVAEAIALLQLRYAVITSVNRDDVEDGGGHIFAATIRAVRQHVPDCRVEVLIPDFKGNWDALADVVDARPDVLNHNMESIPRLYNRVRPQARYERSLELLWRVKQLAPTMRTKSGLMVGLGETPD
ncbi:MAG: lipoyl synthase, partial [Candidatus Tectomicrobia bacterium]